MINNRACHVKVSQHVGRDFSCGDEHRVLAAVSPRMRNIDFQSVRPAPKAFGADWEAAENISAGHTGHRPMFHHAHRPAVFITSEAKHPWSSSFGGMAKIRDSSPATAGTE